MPELFSRDINIPKHIVDESRKVEYPLNYSLFHTLNPLVWFTFERPVFQKRRWLLAYMGGHWPLGSSGTPCPESPELGLTLRV